MAAFGGMMIFAIVIGLAAYVFGALAWMKIGNSLRYEYSWLAWIPVANMFMIAILGDLPVWLPIVLIVGYFIPFVNILAGIGWLVVMIYATLNIARKLGKPEWYCVGIVIPLLNLWVMYDMGWNSQPINAQTTTTWEPPAGTVPPPPPPPPAE